MSSKVKAEAAGWPTGEVLAEAELDRATPTRDATATNMVLNAGTLYVAGGDTILQLDAADGHVLASRRLEDCTRGAARIALAGDVLVVAFGNGSLVGLARDGLDILWRQKLDFAQAVWSSTTTQNATGAVHTDVNLADALWYVTSIAANGEVACVGFSSYQTDPGSYVACVEAASGALRWQREYPGRLCFRWGVSHPCLTAFGLLVPVPEDRGVQLLDLASGSERARLDTPPVGMGFRRVERDGRSSWVTQTLDGTVLFVGIGDDGAPCIERSIAVPGPEGDGLLPSSASPIVVGNYLLCNCPVPSVTRGDGSVVPDGDAPGSVVCMRLDTGEVVDEFDRFSFDATPTVLAAVGEGDGWGVVALGSDGAADAATGEVRLVLLQDDGLWLLPFEDGAFGNPTLLIDEVCLGMSDAGGALVVDEDGVLHLACGTIDRTALYAIG